MFFDLPKDSHANVTAGKALRHLLVFQVKLAADALRDLLMSPVSVVVFLLDTVRKPPLEESLYLRLMLLGRQSDRVINLFDEHKEKGHYSVDEAVETLERIVTEGHQQIWKRRRSGESGKDGGEK